MMKFQRLLFLALLLSIIWSLCSCGNRTELCQRMATADSLMANHPDSSYSLLKGIDMSHGVYSKEDKARYALLLSEAQYKNYVEFENDSLINVAVEYYGKKGKGKDYGKSLMYMGAALYDMMDYNGAVEAYKMAEEVLEPLDEYLLLGLVNTRLAELYEHTFSTDSLAIYRDKRALSFFIKANDIKRINRAYCTIGSSFLLTKGIDSALLYINKSIALSKEVLDTASLLADYGLLMRYYYFKKEYHKAVEAASNIINNYKVNNRDTYHYLAVSYARLGQIDSAYYYYNLVSNPAGIGLRDYVTLSEINENKGDYKTALIYLHKVQLISDSIYRERNNQNVILVGKRFDYQKVALQNQILKNHQEIQLAVIIFSACVLLLLVIILIMLSKRNQRILSSKLSFIEQLKNESNMAQNKFLNELSKKNETEAKLRSILEEKITILKQLAGVSYQYNSGRTKSGRDALLREYNKIIKVGKLGEGVFKDISEIVNIQCAGIIEHIRNEYPTLNDDDLYFISLLCCGFTTTSICAFYGYKSLEVAYVRKSRLSKRMKLQIPIDDYINNTIKTLKNINSTNS